MTEEITQRRGPHEQRGVWSIVKGKGECKMRDQVHCMTGHRGELGSQKSWCGQWFIVLTPVVDAMQAKWPEVYCKKCLKSIGEL